MSVCRGVWIGASSQKELKIMIVNLFYFICNHILIISAKNRLILKTQKWIKTCSGHVFSGKILYDSKIWHQSFLTWLSQKGFLKEKSCKIVKGFITFSQDLSRSFEFPIIFYWSIIFIDSLFFSCNQTLPDSHFLEVFQQLFNQSSIITFFVLVKPCKPSFARLAIFTLQLVRTVNTVTFWH